MTKFIFSAFVFLVTGISAQAQLTIDSCQEKARHNYPLIKQFELIEHAKHMNIANANRMYLPQLSLTAMGNIINGLPEMNMEDLMNTLGGISMGKSAKMTTANTTETKFIGVAQLNQIIWDGGMIHAQKKMVNASAEAEKQQVEVTLFAIKEQVNQLFFGILLIDEQLGQLDILEESLNKNLQRAQTALANGVIYLSDVYDLQVELLNLLQNRTQLLAGKKTYTEMLSYLINEPIDSTTEFEKPLPAPLSLNTSIARPEIKLFEQQRTLFNAQQSALTAGLMPKVGITGYGVLLNPSQNLFNQKINHILMAGISLSWNIGNMYTLKNNRNTIKNEQVQLDLQEETFRFNINLKLLQQQNEIEKSKKLLESDTEIIRLRNNSKMAAETKYENGICTLSELIKKINDESLARQSKALHEIQFLLNIYNYHTTLNN